MRSTQPKRRKNMLRNVFKSMLFVSALVLLAASPSLAKEKVTAAKESPKAVELREDMRKLWEDHVTWTRNYIISSVAGLEDEGKVAERLLKNQDDIGTAIKPFYGNEAGKQLTALLRDHILVAVEVVK